MILRDLPVLRDERLLASWGRGEDAALWAIDESRTGILTVDFITPVSDDPETYGAIAAANSISDVWAMGGRPIVALNVVGFPTNCEPIDTLRSILHGGAQKAIEAGVMLAGGHSVQDAEPKYGLVVYGEVERGREWRTDGAREGDALILTKPLGTGIAITAIKAGLFSAEDTDAAMRSMSTLNDVRRAAGDDVLACVRAATDVTGFGLAGHALDMTGPELDLVVRTEALPMLPGVRAAADMGLLPAGAYANRSHSGPRVVCEMDGAARTAAEDALFDPQTSGGLLLAVPSASADALLTSLRSAYPSAAVIGEFTRGSGMLRAVR